MIMKKKKRTLILFATLIVLSYGTWYAYCHYYPILLERAHQYYSSLTKRPLGSSSTDVVNSEYHFGDTNSTHLTVARRNGIKPVSERNNLQTKTLIKIESCDLYLVEHLTHSVPYLTHESANLLEEISIRFQKALKEQGFEKHRIIITSVLRTKEDVKRLREVNGNASDNSAHQYATTFDITYIRFDRQSLFGKNPNKKQLANILGEVLKQLRHEGRCYIKYERKQRCFHITSKK